MKKLFFSGCLALGHSLCALQPTQTLHGKTWTDNYQDQLVNNQVIAHGRVTGLQNRYAVIHDIVTRYKRPITLLDIGAAQGYYAFRLAHERPQDVYVMIEEDPYLAYLAQRNTELNNIVCLQKRVTIQELEHLGQCEHFDIVLALNVIHWSEDKWREMADAILTLGDHILIETPPAGDNAIGAAYLGDIEKYIEAQGATILLQLPRHTGTGLKANFYHIQQKKTFLTRAHWFDTQDYVYEIHSDLLEKKQIKYSQASKTPISTAIRKPGISDQTFQALQGVFPVKK